MKMMMKMKIEKIDVEEVKLSEGTKNSVGEPGNLSVILKMSPSMEG